MTNYNQLKTRAQQVRDEQTIGGNTALRVGQLLMDMVDAESETVDNIVEMFTGTEDNPVIPTLPNPGLLHWLQSPIVALVSMGEALDGDAGAVVQEGDLYYYNHSGYQIFVKGAGGLPGTGYKAHQKVLYLNKYTGKLYEWTGADMSEIVIAGAGDITIVNDLTTGGPGDALSAEMGLRLKANIDAVQANIVKLYAKLANMAFWDSTDHGDAEPTALDWSIPKVTATITNSIGANAVIKKNGSVVGSSVQVDQGSPLVLTIEAATGYELSNVAATIGGVAQTLTENNGVYTLSIDHVNSSITIAITGSASMLWHTMAKTNVEDGNGNVVEYGIQQGRSINPTTLDVAAGLSGSTPLVVLAPLGNPTDQYIMTTNTDLTGPGNAEPYFIPTFGKQYLHFKMSGGTLSSGQVPKICIACYKESIVDGFSYSKANVQSRGITRIPYQAANNGDKQWKIDLYDAVNNPTGGSAGSPVAGDIKFVKVLICVYPNGTSTTAVDSRTWFDNFSFAYKITDD